MGALPKRRTSRARQGERRSHLHLRASNLVECSQCHKPRLPHRACPSCGYYRGMQVIAPQEKPARSGSSR